MKLEQEYTNMFHCGLEMEPVAFVEKEPTAWICTRCMKLYQPKWWQR